MEVAIEPCAPALLGPGWGPRSARGVLVMLPWWLVKVGERRCSQPPCVGHRVHRAAAKGTHKKGGGDHDRARAQTSSRGPARLPKQIKASTQASTPTNFLTCTVIFMLSHVIA